VPVDRWPGTDCPACPVLHVPPGSKELFRRVVGAWGNDDLIEKAFELREYDPAQQIEIGPIRISFQPVPHFTETFAMSISSTNGSGRIVYGADSAPTEVLAEFARDADLMLVEATLPRPERTGMRGHLTPEEAGGHARGAGAKRLLLVHISDELDADWARDEAAEAFGGPVEVAAEGATFEV
jgi:ribonuclease BN (tRNA processing enzyme)